MPDDIYSLLMGDDEPTAAEKAAAMAQALRGQRGAGGLALLTGDRVLGNFGQALLGQAQQGEGLLAQAGTQRAGNVLKRALEAQQNATMLAKAQADATRRAAEREQQQEFQAEQNALGRTSRERAAAITAGDKDEQQRLTREGEIRREVMGNPVVRAYQDAAVSFDKMQRAAADPSAAGDLALIFAYMKTLDPGSTVREGEFASAQNAAGIPERIRNAWNKGLSGERLSPDQRAEFLRNARESFAAQKQRADSLIKGYSAVAAGSGVAPERVVVPGAVVDIDLSKPSATAASQKPSSSQPLKDVQSLPRLQPGQKAADVMEEGRYYRINMGGGQSRLVVKRGGKVLKVTDSAGR